MTAVEKKAKELIERFENGLTVKDYALIAVDEIIDQWEYIYAHIADGMGELNPNLKYWYEVKHELIKSK